MALRCRELAQHVRFVARVAFSYIAGPNFVLKKSRILRSVYILFDGNKIRR